MGKGSVHCAGIGRGELMTRFENYKGNNALRTTSQRTARETPGKESLVRNMDAAASLVNASKL